MRAIAAHDTPKGTRMMWKANVKAIWARAHGTGSTAASIEAPLNTGSPRRPSVRAGVGFHVVDPTRGRHERRHPDRMKSARAQSTRTRASAQDPAVALWPSWPGLRRWGTDWA